MISKHKHLEFIRDIIIRLSTNSPFLKGGNLTLILSFLALSVAANHPGFAFLIFLPATLFWVLDGFLLWQEQLYRRLYDNVGKQREEDIDFSMDTTPFKKGLGW